MDEIGLSLARSLLSFLGGSDDCDKPGNELSPAEAIDQPKELLLLISGHTLQGNVVHPDRNMEEELKLWKSTLPQMSGEDVAELASPLAKRVLAAEIPKLLRAESSDLIFAWGKVMGRPLLREIASFETGVDESVRFDDAAVAKLRDAIIRGSAARGASAKLRLDAEIAEAKFLIERVAPKVAKKETVTIEENRIVCTLGSGGNDMWITVENGGTPLNNVVVSIKVDFTRGGDRTYAFFTPHLAANESLRAKKSLGDDSEFGGSIYRDERIQSCNFSLWSEELMAIRP